MKKRKKHYSEERLRNKHKKNSEIKQLNIDRISKKNKDKWS
jgi:hypothetical protein